MFREQRIEIILNELSQTGIISIESLAEKIEVSQSTIRRDIDDLEAKRMLKKVRGGAVAAQPATSFEPPFAARQDFLLDEKKRISEAACSLVNPNETLFISSGTTLCEFSKKLNGIPNLYIATNDLMSAIALSSFKNISLMVLGGSLRHNHLSITGYFTENMINQIHADKAFIGVDAVDLNTGFMNYSMEEIPANKSMIKAARETIVLCDHSKFSKIAFVNICHFSDVDVLITDKGVDMNHVAQIKEYGTEVIVV